MPGVSWLGWRAGRRRAARREIRVSTCQALHPARESLLVFRTGRLGGMDIPTLLGCAVLAEFELAFDARNWNAEAHDAREHGAAKAFRHSTPAIHEGRLMCSDETGEESLLGRIVFDQRKRAPSVNGDVIPRGHRELLCVKSWRNITVGAREDDQRFATSELLPVRIGLGEMALKKTVISLILDHQRKMGGHGACARLLARRRAEKGRERIGPHGFEKDGAIVNLTEFG